MTRPSLPHALAAAERGAITTRFGVVGTYEHDGGRGRVPVLLLHSTGAHGCAYELHGVYEALRGERPLVVAELAGYGLSEPSGAGANPEAALSLVEELVREVALRRGREVDVVAVGQMGEIAARAVAQSPRHVRSLVVVAPPHLGRSRLARAVLRVAAPIRRGCASALGVRAVGAALHYVVTTRAALRVELARRTREVPHGLVHHAHVAARQRNAYRAPVAALRAGLCAPVEEGVLPAVPVPLLLVVGGEQVARGVLRSRLREHGRVVAVVPGTRALPHVERPVETAEAMRAFWAGTRTKPELRLVQGARAGRTSVRGSAARGRGLTPDRARGR